LPNEFPARDVTPVSLDEAMQRALPELKRIAHARLYDSGNLTLLATTELVNETFLKLSANAGVISAQKGEFLAYCSRTMRSIIIDYVRARSREKRGSGANHTELGTQMVLRAEDDASAEILSVHEAIESLAALDARMAQIVEMRYFGGFEDDEIATALSITDRTVRREWQKAKLFLAEALT
jgi:RNA polymerase sigma factor (TIGR02999 family)